MIRALLLALLAAAPASATSYVLTVSTTGPKSTSVITSSNPSTGIWCGSSHTACTATFTAGTVVTLTEVTGSTVVFAGWTYTLGCAHNLPTCQVTMGAARAVSAKFMPILGVGLHGNGGGVVTSTSLALSCGWTGACAGGAVLTKGFTKGTQIVLTEVADGSSTFTGWTGDAGCGHASTCTFTLNGYEVITATFSSTGPYTIAVKKVGQGTIRSSPAGINCGSTCSGTFAGSTSITLSTLAASGYFFAGWANGGCSGKTTPCVVIASSTQQGLGGLQTPTAFFYRSP